MNNNKEKEFNEDTEINLLELWKIMLVKKRLIIGVITLCTAGAFIIANILPKEYTATAVLQTKEPKNIINYIEYMKNPKVVVATIQNVYENEEIKPDIADFTKKNLDIVNTRGTQMIQINAKGRNPEEAKKIADKIVENFMMFVVNINNENDENEIEKLEVLKLEAKAESDKAGQDLEVYRTSNGINTPINQSIALLGNVNGNWIISEGNEEYQKCLRNFIIKQSIYNNYVSQIEKLRMTKKSSIVDVKIISDAVLPSQPSGPKIKMITLIGFTVGCLLSVLYSLVIYKKECG